MHVDRPDDFLAVASSMPVTLAVRRALFDVRDEATISDLLFLERWEMTPLPCAASALRMVQIRRANPDLAAAVRAEVKAVAGVLSR